MPELDKAYHNWNCLCPKRNVLEEEQMPNPAEDPFENIKTIKSLKIF